MSYGINPNLVSNKEKTLMNTFRENIKDKDELASSDQLLMAIKKEEAQFEELKRKLETDRQNVANQLEQWKSKSETVSINSLSSEELWFRSLNEKDEYVDEEDLDESSNPNMTIESCLKTLQEKGVVNDDNLPPRSKGSNKIAHSQSHQNFKANNGNEESWNFKVLSHSSAAGNGDRKLSIGNDNNATIDSNAITSERSLIRSSYKSLPKNGINIIVPDRQIVKPYRQKSSNNTVTKASSFTTPRKNTAVINNYTSLDRSMKNRPPHDYSSTNSEQYQQLVAFHNKIRRPDAQIEITQNESTSVNDGTESHQSDSKMASQRTHENNVDISENPTPRDSMSSDMRKSTDVSNDYLKQADFMYDSRPMAYYGQRKASREWYLKRPSSHDGYGEGIPEYYTMPRVSPHDNQSFFRDSSSVQFGQTQDQDQILFDSRGNKTIAVDRVNNQKLSNSTRLLRPNPAALKDESYTLPAVPFRDNRTNKTILHEEQIDTNSFISGRRPSRQLSTGRRSSATSSLRSVGSSQKYSWAIDDAINLLKSDSPGIIVNAAAHLQHACFNNDQVKAAVKRQGAIPQLVRLIDNENEEIQLSAIAALRNLAFGKCNDENKTAIYQCRGVSVLANVLKRTGSPQVREEITRLLWNLSTLELVREEMLNLTLDTLAKIIEDHSVPAAEANLSETQWPTIYSNATGMLRNLSSSDNITTRQMIRKEDRLIHALLSVVHNSVQRKDYDSKCLENSVCILRNLSYDLKAEVDDGLDIVEGYKKIKPRKRSLFSKVLSKSKNNLEARSIILPENNRTARGVAILWQTSTVETYLTLLAESRNTDILEAASGAIHNLTACNWRFSGHIRYVVRRDKGLETFFDLLQFDDEKVFTAVVTALNNLSLDDCNKDIIGDSAIQKLVEKLPGFSSNFTLTDDTLCTVLKALCVLVYKNSDNASRLLQTGTVPHIIALCMPRSGHGKDVINFSNGLMYTLWQYKNLRHSIKRNGWDKNVMKKCIKESANLPDVIHIRPSDIPDAIADNDLEDEQIMIRPTSINVASNYVAGGLTSLTENPNIRKSLPEAEVTIPRLPLTQEEEEDEEDEEAVEDDEVEGSVFSSESKNQKSKVNATTQLSQHRITSIGSQERGSTTDRKSGQSSESGQRSYHSGKDIPHNRKASRKSSSNSQEQALQGNVVVFTKHSTDLDRRSSSRLSLPSHKSKIMESYTEETAPYDE